MYTGEEKEEEGVCVSVSLLLVVVVVVEEEGEEQRRTSRSNSCKTSFSTRSFSKLCASVYMYLRVYASVAWITHRSATPGTHTRPAALVSSRRALAMISLVNDVCVCVYGGKVGRALG